ncbi:MAG: DUF5132 domain-containing protein [Acidobacteria bacterium]|nr:DUF5132 domain-containing protein [Acidobacteriota bacterium]
MALLDDFFKRNLVTGLAVGIGALLLTPAVGQVLRPAAKAVIKGGILVYQGLAELGESASDLFAEARAEMDQPTESDIEPKPSSPARRRSRPVRVRSKE